MTRILVLVGFLVQAYYGLKFVFVEIIQGIDPDRTDLGLPTRRDPDALPPSNRFEWIMNLISQGFTAFWSGNTLFALKAGLLTSCVPSTRSCLSTG
jgi:hypothetical protein